MTTLLLRLRRPVSGRATAAALTLGVVAAALMFSASASAQSRPLCSDDVSSSPTGPATVSVASTTAYGPVLVIGSGDYAGCSVYMLTSDQLHALTGEAYGCSDNANALGEACDTGLWPALLTKGKPIAGPGVNPELLGTVTRTDMSGLPAVQQVTYAGQPLYRFFLNKTPGDTQGANLDDPVTSPPGIWYLVNPRGTPATGQAHLQLETAPVDGTGSNESVVSAMMNNDFSVFLDASFPVYTLNRDHGHAEGDAGSFERSHGGGCQGLCSVFWPPVLTSTWPEAGSGVDQHALGVIARPDGTQQVTYHGRPLYLFNNDAYISAPGAGVQVGAQGIYGADANTLWGEFDTIPSL